jgi:hypothetical protein
LQKGLWDDIKNHRVSKSDKLVVLATMFHVVRIIFLQHVRVIGYLQMDQISNEHIIRHIQENILLQLFQNAMASLCANGFTITFLSTATGLDVFPIIKIGRFDANPQTFLTILRLLLILHTTCASVMWALVGLYQDQDAYNFYRRLVYLPFGCVVLFITGPMLLYFGQRIITIFYNSYSKKLAMPVSILTPSIITETPSSVPPKEKALSLLTRMRHVHLGLRIILYSVCFFLNFLTGSLFICTVFVQEFFQANQNIFLIMKILFDTAFFFSSTIFAMYLLAFR